MLPEHMNDALAAVVVRMIEHDEELDEQLAINGRNPTVNPEDGQDAINGANRPENPPAINAAQRRSNSAGNPRVNSKPTRKPRGK